MKPVKLEEFGLGGKEKAYVTFMHPDGLRILEREFDVIYSPSTNGPKSEAALMRAVKDMYALVVSARARDQVTATVIEAQTKLRVIGCPFSGVDNIDVEAATKKGIYVINAAGANADSVADHTIGLILCLVKNIARGNMYLKTNDPNFRRLSQEERYHALMGSELQGKTIGIVGLGQIGTKVAHRARCFGMNVLVYEPKPIPERLVAVNAALVNLETLLKDSDIVTLHCALTPETIGLIGSEQLALMKKTAYLINTSRGSIVDETALYEVLSENIIAGAGLDVFSDEPVDSENPLVRLENTVVTPHISGATRDVQKRQSTMVAEDIVRVLKGVKPKFAANILP